MRELISPGAMRRALRNGLCPWCGYSLEGLETPRHELTTCPECGHDLQAELVVPDPREAGPRTIATTPDAGTPGRSKLVSLLVILLIAIVAAFQQLTTSPAAKAAGQPPLAPSSELVPAAPMEFELAAKIFVKFYYAFEKQPSLGESAVTNSRDAAQTPAEHLRAAIVAGEVGHPEVAREILDKLGTESSAESPFGQDIATVKTLYDEDPGSPSAESLERLKKRYGWFGELAATHDLDENSPARQAVVGGGGLLLLAMIGAVAIVGTAFIAGIVLFIVFLVRATQGNLRARLIPPLPGGSVAIETVAVFVLGFIALKVLSGVVDGLAGDQVAIWFAMGAQWLLILCLFYPTLRGMPARQWLPRLGLYRGEGVLKEMGAGFVAYLACLPVLAAGLLVTLVLIMVQHAVRAALWPDAKPGLPDNPVVDLLGSGDPWLLALFFLLASLWAPLVEESIFRGCLYRHLRSGWHWFPAALVTGLAFGFMHGYPVLMLTPVISLGFCFALMREWRGSLIASMTAHCIHNASALIIMLSIFKLAGM